MLHSLMYLPFASVVPQLAESEGEANDLKDQLKKMEGNMSVGFREHQNLKVSHLYVHFSWQLHLSIRLIYKLKVSVSQ